MSVRVFANPSGGNDPRPGIVGLQGGHDDLVEKGSRGGGRILHASACESPGRTATVLAGRSQPRKGTSVPRDSVGRGSPRHSAIGAPGAHRCGGVASKDGALARPIAFLGRRKIAMFDAVVWGLAGAVVLLVWWSAVSFAARRSRAVRARNDRELQQTHWATQTAHLTHPNTCPREVLTWLAEPLVPTSEADRLPLLSFQRCASACGHDPETTQRLLLGDLPEAAREGALRRGRIIAAQGRTEPAPNGIPLATPGPVRRCPRAGNTSPGR